MSAVSVEFSNKGVGAGKTTTINMLTGATAPTSGYALVGGKDIRTDMNRIREDIGICMQQSAIYKMRRGSMAWLGIVKCKSFAFCDSFILDWIQPITSGKHRSSMFSRFRIVAIIIIIIIKS